LYENSDKRIKKPTHNERFGVSGAVTRLKVCANLQVLPPSERQWKPRLRQAATALGAILLFTEQIASHANGDVVSSEVSIFEDRYVQ
jgi:hypothetical protein